MDFKYEGRIPISLPPPVVGDIVKNPWFFFNMMSHVIVLRMESVKEYSIIFVPDVEQSKNTLHYGKLSGPFESESHEIRYELETADRQIRMTVGAHPKPEKQSTILVIEWTVNINTNAYDRYNGENFTLNPEHMIKKHFIPVMEDFLSFFFYREEGKEFLLENYKMTGTVVIPKIKERANVLKNCIVIGTSPDLDFYIVAKDSQLDRIVAEKKNSKFFGGDAILEIVNYSGMYIVSVYSIKAESQIEELLEKQRRS